MALLDALLLVFLALLLLLAPTGETPYQTLRLVCYPSDGILSSLDRLPGLVGYLTCGTLRPSYAIHPTSWKVNSANLANHPENQEA